MSVTHIAFLRGINVGGKNKLPMRDLAAMFVQAGCDDVRSYIQSGNVLWRASPSLATQIPVLITAQITERFGYRVPVIVRTAEQLRGVFLSNPFRAMGAAEETLHVLFLADHPDPRAVGELDSHRSPPDTFRVQGSEVYLHLPHGVADTKLTNTYFDTKLNTVTTGRNWRTVAKILELLDA